MRVVVLVLCLLVSGAARAQYTSAYGFSFNNPISAWANTVVWNKMNARLTYTSMLKKRGYTQAQLAQMPTDQMVALLKDQAASAPASSQRPTQRATQFKPVGRRLFLPALAQSLTKDAAQQRALLEAFEQGIRSYEAQARANGLVHDLAGAMAFFIGASYFAYRRGEDPNEKGLDRLALALQEQLDTPRIRSISAAEKQKFYELMLGLGSYLAAGYQQAASGHDAARTEELRRAAGEALRGFLKLDPERVRISEAGLEVK